MAAGPVDRGTGGPTQPWTGASHAGAGEGEPRELARAIKRARDRVRPEDVGLPAGLHRRVPGLRREELAMLAGISVDYVVRLEQARGPQPSEQVLTALCRALRLDTDERDQVFHLAGTAPPHAGLIDLHVRPSVLRLIDRFARPAGPGDERQGRRAGVERDVLGTARRLVGAAARAAQPAAAALPARPERPAAQHGGRHPGRARATAAQTVANLRSVAGALPRRPRAGAAARGPARGVGGVPRALGRHRRGPRGAATPRRCSTRRSACCAWSATPCTCRTPTRR